MILVTAKNPYDPASWSSREVDDLRKAIVEEMDGQWSPSARIYRGIVAASRDVTPRTPEDVEALAEIDDTVYLVEYPQDPITALLIVVGVVAVGAAAVMLMPKIPTTASRNIQADSPNNELSERTNKPRPNGRIPDIYGRVRSTPDLVAVPYTMFENNQELEVAYMCIGRGSYEVAAVCDDSTPVEQIEGVSVEIYGPNTSPNSGSPERTIGSAIGIPVLSAKRATSVTGQTLEPASGGSSFTVGCEFQFPNKIVAAADTFNYYYDPSIDDWVYNSIATDLTAYFSAGSSIIVSTAPFTEGAFTVDLSGTYTITSVTATEIVLSSPAAVNSDWDDVDDLTGDKVPEQTTSMASDGNGWIGPFVLDLREATKVLCNVVAQQGLYKDDGTNQFGASVSFEAEVTPVDTSGYPTGASQTFSGTLTGSSSDKKMKALTLECVFTGFTGRCRVRMRRTTPKDTAFKGTVVDEVKWRDCYALAPVTKSHFGNVTTVLARTYATDGALAVKDRKLNLLVTRKLPARSGDFAFAGALTATRSAADILCAMAIDPYIGGRTLGTLADAGGTGELDVPQIYDTVDAIVDYFGTARAAEFNYTFDKADLSFQESFQLVAQTVFCQAYRRGSVLRIAFEKPQTDSILLLNHRNKVPDSEVRTTRFGPLENFDGVALQYVDHRDDAVLTLYVPQGEASAVNPKKIETIGIRTFEQAYLHAWREWNKLKYQYLLVEATALQEADVLVRTERVLVADNTRADVVDGDVLDQDVLELILSQEVTLDPLKDYTIFLQTSTGAVEAISVVQGSAADRVLLDAAPSVPLVLGTDGAASCSTFAITCADNERSAIPMLLTEKDQGDGFTVPLKLVNYDVRFYSNDLDFYPVVEDDTTGAEPTPPATVPDNTLDPDATPPTADPGVSVGITPGSLSTSSTHSPSRNAVFTAAATGGTVTSYTWGLISGAGQVIADGNTAMATLQSIDYDGIGSEAIFYCDMVIAGITYRAFCSFNHTYSGTIMWDREYL